MKTSKKTATQRDALVLIVAMAAAVVALVFGLIANRKKNCFIDING